MKKNIKIEDLFDGYENRQLYYNLVNKALDLGLTIEDFVKLFDKAKKENTIIDLTGEGYLFKLSKMKLKIGVKAPNLLCSEILEYCFTIIKNETFQNISEIVDAIEKEQKRLQTFKGFQRSKPIYYIRWEIEEDNVDCISLFANYSVYCQSKGSFLTIIHIK